MFCKDDTMAQQQNTLPVQSVMLTGSGGGGVEPFQSFYTTTLVKHTNFAPMQIPTSLVGGVHTIPVIPMTIPHADLVGGFPMQQMAIPIPQPNQSQQNNDSESDGDIHMCGSCRQEFKKYTEFQAHKKVCQHRKERKSPEKVARVQIRMDRSGEMLSSGAELIHAPEQPIQAKENGGYTSQEFPKSSFPEPVQLAANQHGHFDINVNPSQPVQISLNQSEPVQISLPRSEPVQIGLPQSEPVQISLPQSASEYIVLADAEQAKMDVSSTVRSAICQSNTELPEDSSPAQYLDPPAAEDTGQHTSPTPDTDVLPTPETRERLKPNKVYKEKICSFVGCLFTAKHSKDLARHFKTHTGEKPFSCEQCGKSFARQDKLRRHMNIHTGTKKFACPLCPYRTYEKSHFTKHSRVHTDERPYECQMCSYRCKSSSQLTVHLRTHTGDSPFVCSHPRCSASFKSSTDLKRHVQTHTGHKPFKCDFCDYRVICKSNLKTHIRANHRINEVFKCKSQNCMFVSCDKSVMREHFRLHPEILHCPAASCQFTTLKKSSLLVHQEKHRAHSLYKCEYCTYTCRSRNVLSNHKNRRHACLTPGKPEESKTKKLTKTETSSSSASQCSKTVLVKALCKSNFKCGICGCEFVRKDSLNSHLNQHRKAGTQVPSLRELEDCYIGGNINKAGSVKVISLVPQTGYMLQNESMSKPGNPVYYG